MIEYIMKYIEASLPYIESLGPLVYLLVFLIALLEAVPVLGVITPGTALLIFFGYVASHGNSHLVFIIISAFLGAVSGDLLGYFLGKYGGHWMEKHEKLLTKAHFEAGKKFFDNHGGKSIFIGRFFGPLRAILSIIAGMAKMSFAKFNFYNILGAVIWVNLYVLIGFFFGHEWRKIDHFVSKFTKEVLILGVFIVIVVYIRRKYRPEVLEDIHNS
ncbi:MAG: DedA family protein [Candidatus Taylorbacteria bacterium]|nr:DedA family protein [Candidatus Taylorbacteria bacterium]